MSALNEQEEFEFLYQMEKDAKRGIPPPNPAPVKASMGDVIAGTPVARLAMGAASPLIGAAQLGAHVGDVANRAMGVEPVVSPWIDRKLQEYEAAKQRGMKAAGTEGTDWMGVMGSTIPSAAITKAVPAATTIGKRILSGMGAGGVAAGTQPIADGQEDFWTKKGLQTGAGTLLGGAIPAVQGAVQWGAKAIAPVFDIFRGEKGIENLTRKGLEKNVGKEHVEAVANALSQSRQTVPGYKPTASEALAYTPEGSPVQALQRITARTEGGPSAAFGERALKQQGAVKIAEKTRDILTAPMREAALDAANQTGQLKVDTILQGTQRLGQDPQIAGSPATQKAITAIQEHLQKMADPATGQIDARTLYQFKKEGINQVIDTAFEKVNPKYAEKFRAVGITPIKGMIDDAIEAAGGTGWKDYLKEYGKRSQAVADVLATKKLSLKPTQPTTLEASKNLATAAMPHVALLSRPVVMANALLSHLGKTNIEPKIDLLNQQLLLDPNRMGQFLRGGAPSRNQAMIEALMQQVPAAAGTVSGRAIGGY